MKRAIIIVGASGVGKTTVANVILENPKYSLVRSATTRKPREDGNDSEYIYLSNDEFQNAVKNGEMLEFTEYGGNFYGTPKKETLATLESGKNVILELEVEGAMNIKAQYPEAILILFLPPSFAVQEQRLRKRGTETEEKICARLERTKEELKLANAYDYVVYNHDFRDAEAAQKILNIIDAELSSIKRNPDVEFNYFAN